MTDRHAGYIVTLRRDVREDDADAIVGALRMVKGVLSVEPVVADVAVHMAEERVRHDARMALYALGRKVDDPDAFRALLEEGGVG